MKSVIVQSFYWQQMFRELTLTLPLRVDPFIYDYTYTHKKLSQNSESHTHTNAFSDFCWTVVSGQL